MLTDSESALARAVLLHGPISRARLSDRLGLSPASLTRLVKPFLDQDILVEREEVAAGIGRPSRPLDISPRLGRFVGVKVTADRLYAVCTDVRASLLATAERPLAGTSPEEVAAQIVDIVPQVETDAVGVGVCVSGSVAAGVVHRSPFLGWSAVPFERMLQERLTVPVTIDNDVIALAEAERWFGFGRGVRGFLLVTVGAGVGYCLVIGDEVVRSDDVGLGAANDLVFDRDETGRVRVVGEMLSSPSIVRRSAAASGRPIDWDDVLQLGAEGDPAVLPVLHESADALGKFLAVAATLTLQDVVILAGEGIGLLAVAEDRVRAAIAAYRPAGTHGPEIVVDRTGFSAWARGAAAVAIRAAIDRLDLDRALT